MEDRLKQPVDESRRVSGLKGWIEVRPLSAPAHVKMLINLSNVRSIETPFNGPGMLIRNHLGHVLVEETYEQLVSMVELAS